MAESLNVTPLGEDQNHSEASSWGSNRGTCTSAYMQPAGLNMDQGVPAQAVGTSDAPQSDFLSYPIHVTGQGASGAKNTPDPESQASVF